MNTTLNDRDHMPLPRLYGASNHARTVMHEPAKNPDQGDIRIQRIKLEVAALQLQEMHLQLMRANESNTQDQKDWIKMTSVMCKSLELVLDHIKNDKVSREQHNLTQKTAAMLSHKQIQILQMVAKGMSNKSISAELNIKTSSLNQMLSRTYKTLGVSSRMQAVSFCNNRGLI